MKSQTAEADVAQEPQSSCDRVQAAVLELTVACERLMQLPALAEATEEADVRAIRTARAALASGDDVSVRMGVRVLLAAPALGRGELGSVDLVLVAEAQRAVDSYQHVSLRLLDAALVQDDVHALDDAISGRNRPAAADIVSRYPGVLDPSSPLALGNLRTLHALADERRHGALALASRQVDALVDGLRGIGAGAMAWCAVPRITRHFPWSPATTLGDLHDAVSGLVAIEFPDLEPVILSGDVADGAPDNRLRLLSDFSREQTVVSFAVRMSSGRHLICIDAVDLVDDGEHHGLLQINTGHGRERSAEVAQYLGAYLERADA